MNHPFVRVSIDEVGRRVRGDGWCFGESSYCRTLPRHVLQPSRPRCDLGHAVIIAAARISINTLTCSAWLLAIGILGDDAIASWRTAERGWRRRSSHRKMRRGDSLTEITGAFGRHRPGDSAVSPTNGFPSAASTVSSTVSLHQHRLGHGRR